MDNRDRPNPDEDTESIEIELDWSDLRASSSDEEVEGERITLPPPVPTDQYAAKLMATAEGSWEDLPPASAPVAYDQGPPTQQAPPPLDPRRAFPGELHGPESGLRHSRSNTDPSPRVGGASRLPAERAPMAEDGAMHEVRGRFALGDFSGALVIAESILDSDPSHHEAKQFAAKCREALSELYVSRLGGMGRIPQLAVPHDQLHWLALDHRAGFLLSLIDGMSSIEDILDMSGMTNLEALRTMFELMQQDVIHVA